MSVRKLKNYLDGCWKKADCEGYLDVKNPSNGRIIAQVPLSTRRETEAAIDAAFRAFQGWSETPVARRAGFLYDLRQILIDNLDEIVRTLAEEMGKSLPDSRAEMKRAIENVEVAAGMPSLQQGSTVVGCSKDMDGRILRLPAGVFAMIAPFNFPAMVPFWFLPYAIAAGNTFILKPSEQVPCTFQLITDFIHQTGLPHGVFNMVNGDKSVGQVFPEHPHIRGVSVVGSSTVCREVASRCAANGKKFQAMGSAKNHLVVLPDANKEEVIRNMITSCYGCAGQRCMAASVILCVGEVTYHDISRKFIHASKKVIVANPLDPKVANETVVVGPVISAAAKERITRLIEDGVTEGASLALDGRDVAIPGGERGNFIGPTVFVDVEPWMKIYKTEIFGPVVVMLEVDTLEDAIGIINDHEYGNGSSIYTQNGYSARKFVLKAKTGMIGINVGIPAPVAYLPFGGMKASLFSDIKTQSKEVVRFYTEDKILTERYWPPTESIC